MHQEMMMNTMEAKTSSHAADPEYADAWQCLQKCEGDQLVGDLLLQILCVLSEMLGLDGENLFFI